MSDGCTASPQRKDILDCCLAHDRAYYERRISQREADEQFLACLKSKRLNGWDIYVRYIAVRLFGWLWYHT